MPLDARFEKLPENIAVITLCGSMTLGSSLKIAEAQVHDALAQGATDVVLDLAGVDYCDSAGLGVLVHTYGLLNERGGKLRLCGVQPRVAAMLHMTKTDTFLPLDAARDESVAALKR